MNSSPAVYRRPLANFTWDEFVCKGTGNLWWPRTETEKLFFWQTLEATQAVRDDVGFRLQILSGHRSWGHNLRVGGALRSTHLKLAVDLAPLWADFQSMGTYAAALTQLQQAMGRRFGSVGLYRTFVHGDMRHLLGQSEAFWDERDSNWTPNHTETEQ